MWGKFTHIIAYLCASDVSSSCVKSVLDLLYVVDLKEIIASILNIVHRLAMLKEVYREADLTSWSPCENKTRNQWSKQLLVSPVIAM